MRIVPTTLKALVAVALASLTFGASAAPVRHHAGVHRHHHPHHRVVHHRRHAHPVAAHRVVHHRAVVHGR